MTALDANAPATRSVLAVIRAELGIAGRDLEAAQARVDGLLELEARAIALDRAGHLVLTELEHEPVITTATTDAGAPLDLEAIVSTAQAAGLSLTSAGPSAETIARAGAFLEEMEPDEPSDRSGEQNGGAPPPPEPAPPEQTSPAGGGAPTEDDTTSAGEGLPNRARLVLEALEARRGDQETGGWISAPELARSTGLSLGTVKSALGDIEDEIEKRGSTSSRAYRLPPYAVPQAPQGTAEPAGPTTVVGKVLAYMRGRSDHVRPRDAAIELVLNINDVRRAFRDLEAQGLLQQHDHDGTETYTYDPPF